MRTSDSFCIYVLVSIVTVDHVDQAARTQVEMTPRWVDLDLASGVPHGKTVLVLHGLHLEAARSIELPTSVSPVTSPA